MYQVIVRGPDGSEEIFPLGPDQGLVVGREEGADIVLPSKRVSRRHARFFTEGEQLHVEDLGSQNGVFVGGARISGIAEIRPGPPIEIGEFKIRVAKADPRALEAAQVEEEMPKLAGRLVGVGQNVGTTIPLPLDRGFVGRDKTADIPVEDDSVSRKHAEIRLEANSVHIVTDLGSSNGTFVNGNRLKPNLPQRLKHLDKIRLGETHWQYHAGAGQQAAASGGSRKLIAVGVVMIALFAAIAVLRRPTGAAAGEGGEEQGEDTAEQQAAAEVGDGIDLLGRDELEQAKQHFAKALDLDPLNGDARKYLRQTEAELTAGELLRDANTKAEIGRNVEALNLYFQIPTESMYFAKARLRVKDIADTLMRRDSADCREAGRRGQYPKARESCARYLDYKCNLETDKDALAVLRTAEQRTGAKEAWQCPQKLAAWFGNGAQASSLDTEKEIAARYSDTDLRVAIQKYAQGDVDSALRAITKAKGGKAKALAEELSEQVLLIQGNYKEGQTAYLRNNLAEAQRAFEIALRSDERVMPPKIVSYLAREMRSMLAKGLLEAGRAQFDKGNYVSAFANWNRGVEFSPNDSGLLDQIAKLEQVAEGQLRQEPGCDDLQKILKITRAMPPSAAHAAAEAAIEKDCP